MKFPANAKPASVIILDKDKANKNKMSNFKPSSVLKTFSMVYERAIKYWIVCGLEKLSVYRKNYSSRNFLISLIEEWIKNVDNNFLGGAVLNDLSKAFKWIPHVLIVI